MAIGNVGHPGADQHDDGQRSPLSRRRFISGAAASTLVGTTGASLLLSACQPLAAAPAGKPASSGAGAQAGGGSSSSSSTSGAPAKSAGGDPFPKYAPVANAPTPDYKVDDPRYDIGFDNYPQNPFKSVPEAPGRGGDLNILVANYFPPPTPFEQNPTWQEVNKRLNANVQMNMVTGADYRAKFATIMAGDDLPDIMHIYCGYSVAPSLPAFFKAKCADLTPYLTAWQYVTQGPYVNYQADIPGFAKGAHEAQPIIIAAGLKDPTRGYLSPASVGKDASAMTAWSDDIRNIILGRKQMSEYDTIVKEWKGNVGDTIRKEYTDAMAAITKQLCTIHEVFPAWRSHART